MKRQFAMPAAAYSDRNNAISKITQPARGALLQRIASATVRIGQVGIALVMILMDLLVENLREADRHRLEDTEASIEDAAPEVWIVKEVVRDAVDVPRDADRPDE